ncbi:MAG: ABC transporter substrate-binding protein [Treponema sp.]|nr:ABC transporter substrate-binding protein [Treponema sp.]
MSSFLSFFKRQIPFFLYAVLLSGCNKVQDMTLAEIAEITSSGDERLVSKTVSRPYQDDAFTDGSVGGVWQDSILSDPKTFNQLIAERDSTSAGIVSMMLDYLVDYDFFSRQWKPHMAFFEIEIDEKAGTLTVHYTLRDGLYWTWYGSDRKVPVTSDDFVFWYNEIAGDEQFGSSGYAQQWCTMPDGESKRVKCVKIDDKHFDFIFPRIISDPLLATNMSLCPSFIYKEAKEKGGADGVKGLFPVNADVRSIPSCGKWYLSEYSPSQRLVFSRNPYYWEKDGNDCSVPYVEKQVCQIVGDMNTNYLLFKQGKMDSYMPRPEEVSDVIENQNDEYTVFNADGSLGATLWSFNQNPINEKEPFYRWFCIKQFRQAMSCLLNRDRIISQTYRGLASAKYDFFPDANPMYDPDIMLRYRYDTEMALSLLESAGFSRDKDGIMRDSSGTVVEFDLSIASSSSVTNDIALIISDECSKVGIKVNIRQIDFQKLIEMLSASYDWQSIIIGLGSNMFPSQGSNVWPSSGNLHLWYPLQKQPATDWEARLDYLYNEGCYTNNHAEAKVFWDEFQRIILEQCPVIYLVRSRSFVAVRNKWDLSNVFYDNKNGFMTDHIFLCNAQ